MDNTEGSRVISQTYKARKNLILHLSKQQMQIVLGSILGDAYVYPKGKICFEHGEDQKEYLFWKYSQLKSAAYPKVSQVVRWDKRTQKQTVSWRFFLRQYFRPLRIAFYKNKRKVIPKDLRFWFSPLLLAVWYMDDGYLERKKYPLLMTECFNSQDLTFLKMMLKEKFNLETIVTGKKRLRIKSKNADKFFDLIRPFIHESLTYKLP